MVTLSACQHLLISSCPGSHNVTLKKVIWNHSPLASDQCIENMINFLSSPQSLLNLTNLRRLSINSTASDGRFCDEKNPAHRSIYNNSWITPWWSKWYVSLNDSLSLFFYHNMTLFFEVGYDIYYATYATCPTYTQYFLSVINGQSGISPTFSPNLTSLQLEKSPQDTMHMFQHRDWRIMEHKLCHLNLFSAIRKLYLGLRPKDVGAFMSGRLRVGLKSSLSKLLFPHLNYLFVLLIAS